MSQLSCHAKARAKQRCIPPLVLDWLMSFGEEQHDHRGSVVYYFSHKSIRNLERTYDCQPIRLMSRYLNAYAVERADGSNVLTIGWRSKRLNRG